MADTVNIGGEEDGYAMTWGKLRTAMFKATGYRDTYPRNKNWNGWQRFFDGQIIESNSAGYIEVLGDDLPLIKSTPYGFKWPNFPPTYTVFPNTSAPLCVGANYDTVTQNIPPFPTGRRTTFNFYFAIGEGVIDTYSSGVNTYRVESVYPTQSEYNHGDVNKPVYDYNITKEKYLDAVVNITLNMPVGSSVILDVTITEDCFPDIPYTINSPGKLIHTVSYDYVVTNPPVYPWPENWANYYFTVNSITMPS